jgi:hypothetical protein
VANFVTTVTGLQKTPSTSTVTYTSAATGGNNTKIIGGVPNPKTQIYSDIRNSINGKGSLNSSSVHLNSIQQNINRAISVSKEFSDTPALASLQSAKTFMTQAASAKDATTRNAALANAKAALVAANNTMAGQGYGKSISGAPSISQPNNKIVL